MNLTPRETEVLRLVAYGYSNEQIGASLGIEKRTARGFVSKLLTKFHYQRRSQITAHAILHNLVEEKDVLSALHRARKEVA